MAVMAEHYPTINPQAFSKFYYHFKRLSAAKNLVEGTEDIFTPDQRSRKIALAMLGKAYKWLQPYEETINKDAELLEEWDIVVDIPSVKAVAAMQKLCSEYRLRAAKVEGAKVDESEFPEWMRQIDFSLRHRLVVYDDAKARKYYIRLRHQFELMLKVVIENTMEKRWNETPKEERTELIRTMREENVKEFVMSRFFAEFPARYSQSLVKDTCSCLILGEFLPYHVIQELNEDAYNVLFDEDLFLDEDIAAKYLWEHQHTLSPAQQQGLFVFMVKKEKLREFEVLHNGEHERYWRDWELCLHDYRRQLLKGLQGWWNDIPPDRHGQAIKDRMRVLKVNLYRSGFLDRWKCELDDEEISSILRLNLDNLSTREKFKRVKFRLALQGLMDTNGTILKNQLDIYLWRNRLELSPQQIKSFFTFYYSVNRIVELCREKHIDVNNFFWEVLTENLDEKILGAPFWDKETMRSSNAIFGGIWDKNSEAYDAFVEIVKELSRYICINKGQREGQWKWWHLRDALIKLKFIDKASSKSALARVLSAITGRTFKSIRTSLNRKDYAKVNDGDNCITDDLKDRLSPVAELLKKKPTAPPSGSDNVSA